MEAKVAPAGGGRSPVMVAWIGQSGVGEPIRSGFGMGADHTDAAMPEAGHRCRHGPVGVSRQNLDLGVGVELEQRAVLEVQAAWVSAPANLDDGTAVVVYGGAKRSDVLVGVAGQQIETRRGTREVAAKAEAEIPPAVCDETPDRLPVRAQVPVRLLEVGTTGLRIQRCLGK
jgi:hypothetical protein